MSLSKIAKQISIFLALLGFVMFLSTAKALAASISISANVQGYCWEVFGPGGIDIPGCNDAFNGNVPGGDYSISLISAPSGYFFSGLSGSSNPDHAGNINWVATFTANPQSPPTVDAKANGSDGPITVAYGSTVTITWTSTNADSCSSNVLGPNLPANNTGNDYSYTATTSGTGTINCTGPGGTSPTDSVIVNVGAQPPTPTPTPPPAPTPTPTPTPTPVPGIVNIKCGGSDTSVTVPYGGSTNISWTSSGVSNCAVSPSGWTGTSNSGISTGSLTSTRT